MSCILCVLFNRCIIPISRIYFYLLATRYENLNWYNYYYGGMELTSCQHLFSRNKVKNAFHIYFKYVLYNHDGYTSAYE